MKRLHVPFIEWLAVLAMACTGVAAATPANAEDRVTPGELVVDHPTLINLGFEWIIQGDDTPDLGALEVGQPLPHYGPR